MNRTRLNRRLGRTGFDRFEWLVVAVICLATTLGVLGMTGSPAIALLLGVLMLVVTSIVVAVL